eukprot:9606548-Alexandrium_andersonii.AAC.1
MIGLAHQFHVSRTRVAGPTGGLGVPVLLLNLVQVLAQRRGLRVLDALEGLQAVLHEVRLVLEESSVGVRADILEARSPFVQELGRAVLDVRDA